ncbi:PAS-domain containing protein [Falsiroseomonas oryziterrae]|uniref:PAS-domain containing protein n=1 Tax=Falsiroseomonas oryziterrae TaxID=2911368 RepID=UPI001F1927A9|nr:PAS-domain containing protein [Roseomonas sp. NPKOSM-4]
MTEAPIPLRILDALPQAVSAVDAAGRLAYANPAFWRDAGVPPDACPMGSPLRDLVRMLAYRGLYGAGDPEAQVEAVLALDRSRPIRRQIGLADGSRSFETVSVPLEGGGFAMAAHEVTALLRAREEQAARARLLEATLARLTNGVARFDAEMRIGLFNPAYEALIGLPGGSLRAGLTHRDVIAMLDSHGEYSTGDGPDAVAAAMERGRSGASVRQRERPSGQVLRFDSQPTPDGGVLLEVSDITALKRADDEARRRAALLDGVLDALPHGVCLYGPDRRVRMYNRAYARLFEGSLVEVGERLDDVVQRRLDSGEYTPEAAAQVLSRFERGAGPLPTMRRARPNGVVLENNMAWLPDGGIISVFTEVTALHRAEEAARERAALLDAVLDALPDGVCVYGPDRRARITNPAYRRIFGEAAVRIGESLEEVAARRVAMGEQSPQMSQALLDRHFGPQEAAGTPIRRVRPDGTAIVTRAGRLPDGGHIAVISDITPLHRAEAELQRRAAMLEASFGAMRHGIAVFGADRRLLAFNPRTPDLLGLPAEALHVGRVFDELVAEQVRLGVLSSEFGAIAVSLDKTQPHRATRTHPGGRMIEVVSDPTPDGGFVITFTDVTALHRAEAELRRRAAMQAAMLANIRHGIILYGPDRRVLATNAKTSELTGMTPEELTPGRLMDDLIDWQVARGEIAPDKAVEMKALDRGKPVRYGRARPDGRVLDVVSEPTGDGGYVITYSDVTEDRVIRAELERARAAAEAASEAKSRFLATMSHELRTPLNAVIGFSEAIAAERDPDRVAAYAAEVNEAGRHLLQLVDDILDVARSQTGALEAAQEPFDPAAVVAEAVEAASAHAAASRLQLAAVLPTGLPWLRGDAHRLRQILDKLLSNAVKFTPAGGCVTVSAAAAQGLEIRVADTGIGVPHAERERMFEPFTQLDSSLARRFQGSGLGLHLARALASALGATLSLEDPEGPGLVAVLRFPPERLAPAPATVPSARASTAGLPA